MRLALERSEKAVAAERGARRAAEARVAALEAELAALRGTP